MKHNYVDLSVSDDNDLKLHKKGKFHEILFLTVSFLKILTIISVSNECKPFNRFITEIFHLCWFKHDSSAYPYQHWKYVSLFTVQFIVEFIFEEKKDPQYYCGMRSSTWTTVLLWMSLTLPFFFKQKFYPLTTQK